MIKRVLAATLAALMGVTPAMGQSFGDRLESSATSADEKQAAKEAALPQCDRPLGTVTIVPPETNWWTQANLQSPNALIALYVARSRCFTLVDRGRGFDVARRERELASGGMLQQGSNIGGGQVRAADYVITPDVVTSNNNSGGNALGAILGAFVPGIGGALLSNLRLTEKSAEVTLIVTDVRTSEQWLPVVGKARNTDLSFGVGGGAFLGGGFAAAGVSSYSNTELGKVVALAYLDAFTQVVYQIQQAQQRQGVPPPAEGAQQDTAALAEPVESVESPVPVPQPVARTVKPVATARAGAMYRGPSDKSGRIRNVPAGTIFYPTTNTDGFWWEVTDTEGNTGWIPARILQLGQ